MKITMLGTGHGTATECYNTCFTLNENKDEYFLVDAGGGNGILKQLKDANINIENIKNIFISHTHSDHILGAFWLVRVIARKYLSEGYQKELYIYGNDEVINALRKIIDVLLPSRFMELANNYIKLIKVNEGESIEILNRKCTFFDIKSPDVKQFGFYMEIAPNKKFTFIGDESCQEETKKYVNNSEWLFADAYKPYLKDYEKGRKYRHSTVGYTCEICQEQNVKNVILSHTMDDDLKNRKKLYTEIAKKYYNGKVFVPDDLETIDLL